MTEWIVSSCITGSKAAIKERVTMIARKPKVSMIALTLALLIAALAVGCAFSGARQPLTEKEKALIAETQLSEEAKAEIEKAWANRPENYNNDARYIFETATQFCDPEAKKDGIRYYGSYKMGMDEKDVHILFIPCTDSDTDAQYSPDGKRFTHRTPFVLLSCIAHTGFYPDSDEIYYSFQPIGTTEDAVLSKALELHEAYEKLFHGSVLTEVVYRNDENGLKEVETTWLAISGVKEDLQEYDPYDTCVYLGKFDEYLIVIPNLGGHGDAEWQITIGGHKFNHSHTFVLRGIKDGAVSDLTELYEDGLISNAAIGKIEEKYYEIFPEYRDLFSKN